MTPESARGIVDDIFQLYDRFGAADYIGEPVSQIEHMSQSAELAMQEGFDEEVVLAAFFHDIGHICVMKAAEDMKGFGVKRHEQIGADFLRAKGFPERVAKLVENHVQAKRYLTFKFPEYFDSLSDASRRTLELQGGRMNGEEAGRFEQEPLFDTSIRMRRWDELAKEINVPITDLSRLRAMAFEVLITSKLQEHEE